MCLPASRETFGQNTDTQKADELSVTETQAEKCALTINKKKKKKKKWILSKCRLATGDCMGGFLTKLYKS